MSNRLKDFQDNKIYTSSCDPIMLLSSYTATAAQSARTWLISINGLPLVTGNSSRLLYLGKDISKLRVVISGESTGTTSSVPLYVQNSSLSNLTCFVQGWEVWQGSSSYISRSQAKICDNRILAYNSFMYDIELYPTANTSNYVCFTSRSYGGNVESSDTAQKTCSQNWTGRIQTSASNIKYLSIALPALQQGFKYRIYGEY